MADLSPILDANGNPMRRVTITASSDTAYKAASNGIEMRGWNPSRGSADADLLPEKGEIDARARDLTRNEPVAKSGVNAQLDMVVATGAAVRPMPDYKVLGMTKKEADAWARDVRSRFHDYADSTDIDATRQGNLSDLTRLFYRTKITVGEGTALPVYLPGRAGVRYGTALHLIDPDRISNPNWMPDSETLRQGIEIDSFGAPQGYHIQKAHPSDAFFGSTRPYEWEYVPARTDWGRLRFIHAFEKERPDQHRGLSAMAAMMSQFKLLSEYKGAELQAALTNAIVAAFTESALDHESLLGLFGGDVESLIKQRAEYVVKMKAGAVIPLFPGDSFASHAPARPNTAFGPFVDNVLRHVAVGFDLPYEMLMKDFTKGSYSSIRAAFMSSWKTAATARYWLQSQFLNIVFDLWLEEAVALGDVQAPGFYERRKAWSRCRWIFDGKGWLDPAREAQASQLRLAVGLSTYEDEIADQGKDWEEVMEQRAAEQEYMKSLGLDLNILQQTIAIAPQEDTKSD